MADNREKPSYEWTHQEDTHGSAMIATTASTTLAINTQLLPYTARGPANRGRERQRGRGNRNGKKTSQEAFPLCPFSL